ncbi:hypothetical protein AURDEDRAFT_123936 [Auricularia subglabra TFB-10046 SS5]|nr:hypothetical protein AURDEDRAFT_123936 [Auricularia subglabra TFB-10046 SS5]
MHGLDVSAGFAAYMWTLFSGTGSPFDDGLVFQGTTPSWASSPAAVVIPSMLRNRLVQRKDVVDSPPRSLGRNGRDVTPPKRLNPPAKPMGSKDPEIVPQASRHSAGSKAPPAPRADSRRAGPTHVYRLTHTAAPSTPLTPYRARAPPSYSIEVAETPAEVFTWLEFGRRPFLVPDADFGADLVFCLRAAGVGTLLVALVIDSCAAGPDLGSFYRNFPDQQQKLLSVLQNATPAPADAKKDRSQPLQVNLLRVFCFEKPAQPPAPSDSPIATLDIEKMLARKHIPELSFSDLDRIVWDRL